MLSKKNNYMNNQNILNFMSIFLLLILNTQSRFLHHSLNNLNIQSQPEKKANHLSFLSTYLKKIHTTDGWNYIGQHPKNDIKYKRLISASLKDSLMNIYMNLMDDRRAIKIIFGKIKKKNHKTAIKLIYVIQNQGVNETYIGVELRFSNEKYFCDYKDIKVVRFGKSYKCKDVLNLLDITIDEFKNGPSLDFINYSKKGHGIWGNFPQSQKLYYKKDLNSLIKSQIIEYNTWIANFGLSTSSGVRPHGHGHPSVKSHSHSSSVVHAHGPAPGHGHPHGPGHGHPHGHGHPLKGKGSLVANPLVSILAPGHGKEKDINIGASFDDDLDISN